MIAERPRILVATSGSAAARHATAVAADLASAFGAELVIAHVAPPVEYRVGRLAPTVPITRLLDDPYSNPTLNEARRLAWAGGAAAKIMLFSGDAPGAIVALADELDAELVVIGALHRRWPAALAARTRHWIETHTSRPVLAVPVNQPKPAPTQRRRIGSASLASPAGP